mmetsp:Transcript_46987/g.54882  ORF Transcript_46987/g.54882 Transcript_46987/m.54882 type:complete len:136 (+) Transcript_46987:265-672(+)
MLGHRHQTTTPISSTPAPQTPTPVPPHPSLWIGSRYATTQSHYDVSDNVLIQLSGQKRIRCWNPTVHWGMHCYPDSHPRARKGQYVPDCDAENDDKDETNVFPLQRCLGTPCLDVVLHPGDGVRMPAFWFHHVEV